MSKYIVRQSASKDLEIITDYIYEDSPKSALMIYDELDRICKLLASMPEMGTHVKFITKRKYFMHPLGKFKSYSIFYIIEDGVPHIMRVLHGRRDIENLFDDEKL